jgi:hypothetical protein
MDACNRPKSEEQDFNRKHRSVSSDKKMIKIKSNKLVIKVYNPFPTSMENFI